MRRHSYLVEPESISSHFDVVELPSAGSAERAAIEEEVGNALSDALDESGLSILDLIELT